MKWALLRARDTGRCRRQRERAMEKKVVTLEDIAERLGTTKNTVSRALRDCSDIGAATKERVKQTAMEMGYVPNRIAGFLRSKRSNIIAVVVNSLTNPFYSICMDHCTDYMGEKGYRPLISIIRKDVDVGEIISCVQNGACGILSFLDVTDDAIDYCEQNKIPFLICGFKPHSDRVSALYSDEYQCARLVAQEAIVCGAKHPCFVDLAKNNAGAMRREGFAATLKGAGLGCDIYTYNYYSKEASIVLLKNNGVLPLKEGKKLSICGWYARPCGFEWSKNPEFIVGGGSGRVIRLTPMFDMKELLEEKFGEIAYEYAFSDTGVVDGFMDQAAAVSNAGESDINLVFAGTGSRVESEGGDRTSMRLSAAQERTILDTAEVNPNTVVVLFAGAPIDMSAWLDKVAAVVWAGFPGERGGEALVNILTGAVCPSGKLSETFPKTYEDTPVYREYRDSQVTRYQEGLDVGYRWYDRHPAGVQFPFGFGLSYTTFVYEGLRLETDGERVKVRYDLKNIGKYDAKEVSEVYIRPISPMVYRPLKELKGFEKTFVKAGSSETAEVVLERSAFAYWSTAKDCWTVDDGVYEIDVGASAQDIRLVGKVKVKNGKFTVLG